MKKRGALWCVKYSMCLSYIRVSCMLKLLLGSKLLELLRNNPERKRGGEGG